MASLLCRYGADSVLYGSSAGPYRLVYQKAKTIIYSWQLYRMKKMSLYVICYELITLQKDTKIKRKLKLYRFKVYLFILHTIRVRHSAAACTRLDKYMVFSCKSGASRHCDCVQSITVEKVDAFLELKIFKSYCSTMLRMHFQPIKQYHMTISTVIYWTSPYESRREKAYLTNLVNPPLQNIL